MSPQVLLILNTPIDGEKSFKASQFCQAQQFPVAATCQPCLGHSPHYVTWELIY